MHGAVVNQQGIVRADSFGVNAAGEIVLQAEPGLDLARRQHDQRVGRAAAAQLTLDAGAAAPR